MTIRQDRRFSRSPSAPTRRLLVPLFVVFAIVAGSVAATDFDIRFVPATGGGARTQPPLPVDLPVQLIIDDDTTEGNLGVSIAGNDVQFLWFNQFTPATVPFELSEIWVLFPQGSNMTAGAAIQLAVYFDSDRDPANGADLVTAWNETIQVVDGDTFSVYSVNPPLQFLEHGDVLVGVVNRFVSSGVTNGTSPAALDTSTSEGRSWISLWTGDPPDPPLLPADGLHDLVDVFQPGNWMIRAFGRGVSRAQVPVLGRSGMAALMALVALAGFLLIRRSS